jgi:hypothetical protein
MSGWKSRWQAYIRASLAEDDSISNDQPLCEAHKAKSSNVYEQPALVLMSRVEDHCDCKSQERSDKGCRLEATCVTADASVLWSPPLCEMLRRDATR